MYAACLCEIVGRQRPHECIVGMRGHENLVLPDCHNYGGVVKVARRRAKLYNIADLQSIKWSFLGKRALGLVAEKKIIQVFNASPGGSPVVHISVVPPESRSIIHYARACVNALRCKVRAVAS